MKSSAPRRIGILAALLLAAGLIGGLLYTFFGPPENLNAPATLLPPHGGAASETASFPSASTGRAASGPAPIDKSALPFKPAENLPPELREEFERSIARRGPKVLRCRIGELDIDKLMGGKTPATLAAGDMLTVNFFDDVPLRFEVDERYHHSEGSWSIQARLLGHTDHCVLSFDRRGALGSIRLNYDKIIEPLYQDHLYIQLQIDLFKFQKMPDLTGDTDDPETALLRRQLRILIPPTPLPLTPLTDREMWLLNLEPPPIPEPYDTRSPTVYFRVNIASMTNNRLLAELRDGDSITLNAPESDPIVFTLSNVVHLPGSGLRASLRGYAYPPPTDGELTIRAVRGTETEFTVQGRIRLGENAGYDSIESLGHPLLAAYRYGRPSGGRIDGDYVADIIDKERKAMNQIEDLKREAKLHGRPIPADELKSLLRAAYPSDELVESQLREILQQAAVAPVASPTPR